MKKYAKIDSEGNVLQFPYREAMDLRPNQSLPADAVEVDALSQRPQDLKWYEAIWYDTVENQNGTYVVTYIRDEKKWSSPNEKKATLLNLIAMAKIDIEKLQDETLKASQLEILNTIDANDPNTYDNYHNLSVK